MDESERNNKHSKELMNQIKELQTKNFELQKANKKAVSEHVVNQLKDKNEQIFKLEEKLKDAISTSRKLKKHYYEKELQIKQDCEKESQQRLKKTLSKMDEKELENKNLLKIIQQKDEKLDELKNEVNLVYSKMHEISAQIQSKNIDENYKKLHEDNMQIKFENSKLEAKTKSLEDNIKKRDKTIKQHETERDSLIKKLFEAQRKHGVTDPNDLGNDSDNALIKKDSNKQRESMHKAESEILIKRNKELEVMLRSNSKQLKVIRYRVEQMEKANIALATLMRMKNKKMKLLETIIEEYPPSIVEKLIWFEDIEKRLLASLKELNDDLIQRQQAPRFSKALNDMNK